MKPNLFFKILIFTYLLYYIYCYKGFTIDSEGKNVITTKIINQEFTSIALTEKGTLIKYKSDSSILSTQKFTLNSLISGYTKSFMCQYSDNRVILTRDYNLFEITFNSDGNSSINAKGGSSSENIIYLHCINQNYIYTYLSSDSLTYGFRTRDDKHLSNSQANAISSASCFLLDSTLVLCINIVNSEKKLYYYYFNLNSLPSPLTSQYIGINENVYEIIDSMIKYWSNDEILFCLKTKWSITSDIFLNCSMLNANVAEKNLIIKTNDNPKFNVNERIAENSNNINYCAIEKLQSEYTYASICLSYYYRSTYLLSIFKYDTNTFTFTTNNPVVKNKKLPLLKASQISISSFDNDALGIFYQDIDTDSMIIVFYPKCTNFDQVPLSNSDVCRSIDDTYSIFDECTHKNYNGPDIYIPAKYSSFKKNQFCQIKELKCNENDYYFFDDYFLFDMDRCIKSGSQPNRYYFDSSSKKFLKCYRSCLNCFGQGNDVENNCIECDEENNYYNYEDHPRQCVHKNAIKEHYYFNEITKKFQKCREECLTCTGNPSDFVDTNSDKDTKCLKCNIDSDYWPQVDKPSNCILKNRSDIEKYYFNENSKRWEKCTAGCRYCTQYGIGIYDTKCNSQNENYCDEINDYYPVENDDNSSFNQSCFNKNLRYDHYFFDEIDKIFKKCNEACLQCDIWGNNTVNYYNTTCLEYKCDEKNNYFPDAEEPSQCYKYSKENINHNIPNYYLDPNTKLFKKCYTACSYCSEQIDANENDTQCSVCDNINYFELDGQTDPSNKICIHKDRDGYYKDGYMKKCPEKCAKCKYINLNSVDSPQVYCTKCNNELGFYQIKNEYYDRYSTYMECYTWRAEKINSDNKPPDLNTLLIGNYFERCHQSCSQCTSIGTSELEPHCQAKKCSQGYIYVQNHEDICYEKNKELSLHFVYYDPFLNETYFKPCYQTCQKCLGEGTKRNNNCSVCREGYIKHPNQITNAHNCIFDCLNIVNNNYYYLDEDNNDEYICVEKCPEDYPFLQKEKKRCLKSCETEPILKYSKDKICVEACPEGISYNIKKECVSVTDECVKSDLEWNLILMDINDTNINDLIKNDYCHLYSYTSNQINNYTNKLNEYNIYIYKNRRCLDKFFGSSINFPDLSGCFNDLREYYKIDNNIDLIVMIMNIYNNESYIRVEYKVFDSSTCEELDLSNCTEKNIFTEIDMLEYFSNEEIERSKDMYINKKINVYDREHPFFTDICYQYSYDDDKDMILEDRVNMYYQDISNICEKKCKPEADFDRKIIKCGCELKEKFLLEDNKDNKKKWGYGVGAISIEVLKCTGKAFLWDYFKENIGSYSALVLIVAEIPAVLYFIFVGLRHVRIFLIPFMGSNPPRKNTINSNSSKSEQSKSNSNSISNNKSKEEEKSENENNSNNINNEKNDENKSDRISSIPSNNSNPLKKLVTAKTLVNNVQISKDFNDKNSDDSLIRKDISEFRPKFIKKEYDIYKDIIDIEDLNDVELYDAINFDKRNFCQYYYQELKNTQPIIYSFFYYTPLTPRFFKILHFIFNTTLCFVLNAFFYSKFYISDKCFDFENSFYWYFKSIYDRIIYTCLCTIMISLILRVATSYKKKMIMWIKREKDPEVFNKEITHMMKRMKIIYIIYSSIQGGFMFFFWIYLSCFCIAYKNNEMEWFVTSWICFGLIQIWYFFSTFFITCLRYLGIKCGMESCYNVSICLAFD